MFNPYKKYNETYKTNTPTNTDVFKSTKSNQPEVAYTSTTELAKPVLLPENHFTPMGAQVIDIRALADIPAGSSADLLTYVALPSVTTRFISYAIFNDAQFFNDVEFIPRVNGQRVLPFQGTPVTDTYFKIALGLAPDLSNNSLIECQLTMRPGEKLVWTVVNSAAVTVSMGVRMKGYLDASLLPVQGRFGG